MDSVQERLYDRDYGRDYKREPERSDTQNRQATNGREYSEKRNGEPHVRRRIDFSLPLPYS